jgi:hypothetical protein
MQCLPKCFSLALNNLLTTAVDTAAIRAPTQSGFRRNYRVEDNSVLLKTVLQRCKHSATAAYCLFIDLRKAYDSIDRAKLWEVLASSLPEASDVVACIKQLYV